MNGQILCGAEPADYSAVETAMAAIPTDLTVYTDESVAALNTAVDGVVRGKAFVSQAKVNAMAKAIENAIASLEKKAGENPPTGDTGRPMTWLILLSISGGAVIAAAAAGRKKKY